MIRLIGRRLIIPQGDTGAFSIPTQGTTKQGDVAIFSILDPLTQETVLAKAFPIEGCTILVILDIEDTIDLPPRKYKWDITICSGVEYDTEGKIINVTESNSYFSAFKLPTCEITEVGFNMNAQRKATRDKLLEVYKYQPKDLSYINSIQSVYPWEKMQQSQLEQQLYQIAVDNGFTGTVEEFKRRYTDAFAGGRVINGTIDTFPVPGEYQNIYYDTDSNIIYHFVAATTSELNPQLATLVGSYIVGEEGDLTYLYVPIRALLIENMIIGGGEP